jgi:uncharacterized protein YcbX
MAATVATLFRYPVKSMMGEEINSTALTRRGLYGDRAYAVLDVETGKVASAKNPRKWPTMFRFRAAFTEPLDSRSSLPPVRIMMPHGETITSDDDEIDKTLSRAFDREVVLKSVVPIGAQLEEYWPEVEGLAQQDVVTDESMPPETFFDLATVHLLTTSTLDRLRELNPQSRFEPRRFRPNIIVRTDETGFAENEWIGRTLRIGERVRLKITGPCGRCVMTTLAQGDLPSDNDILRSAVKYNEARVGIYADVLEAGTVRSGDAIVVE